MHEQDNNLGLCALALIPVSKRVLLCCYPGLPFIACCTYIGGSSTHGRYACSSMAATDLSTNFTVQPAFLLVILLCFLFLIQRMYKMPPSNQKQIERDRRGLEAVLKREEGKHVWEGGLLESLMDVPKHPCRRCFKCKLTMSELEQMHNTGVCDGKVCQ
jgi:hypothetical protein